MLELLILSILPSVFIYLGFIFFKNLMIPLFGFYIITCLIYPVLNLIIIQKLSISEFFRTLGFRNFRKNLAVSLGLSIFFFIVIYFSLVRFGKNIIDVELTKSVLTDWGYRKELSAFILFITIIVNPFFEELFWRGFMFSKFRKKVSIGFTIFFCSFFYAAYHIFVSYPILTFLKLSFIVIGVFFAGLIWGLIRYKTDSIYPALISHFFADLAIIFGMIKILMI